MKRPVTAGELSKALGISVSPTLVARFRAARVQPDVAASLLRLFREDVIGTGRDKIGSGATLNAKRLGDAIGVHRNTMMKVVAGLERAGYLERKRGRGAVVRSSKAQFPEDSTEMVSHWRTARDRKLKMESITLLLDRSRRPPHLGGILPHGSIQHALGLDASDAVITWIRLRVVFGLHRTPAWCPVLAEVSFFPARHHGLPDSFFADLQSDRINSVAEYLETEHSIPVRADLYRLSVMGLPTISGIDLRREWVRHHPRPTAADRKLVKAGHWLRIEATNYSLRGRIQHSVSYVPEGLFTITTSKFSIDFSGGPLADRGVGASKV